MMARSNAAMGTFQSVAIAINETTAVAVITASKGHGEPGAAAGCSATWRTARRSASMRSARSASEMERAGAIAPVGRGLAGIPGTAGGGDERAQAALAFLTDRYPSSANVTAPRSVNRSRRGSVVGTAHLRPRNCERELAICLTTRLSALSKL